MLAVLLPLLALTATYAFVSPWLRERNAATWQRLHWRSPLRPDDGNSAAKKQASTSQVLLLFVATVAVVVPAGLLVPGGYANYMAVLNTALAMLGVYVVTRKPYLVPLVLPLLFVPHAENSLTALAVVGAFYVVSNSLNVKTTKVFVGALIVLDVVLVSSGLFTAVFPLSVGVGHSTLNFFSFPFGVRVGGGDFFSLLLFSNVVLAERGPRLLVGATYLVGMAACMLLVVSGTFSLLPATLPLVPALLLHQLLLRRSTNVVAVEATAT